MSKKKQNRERKKKTLKTPGVPIVCLILLDFDKLQKQMAGSMMECLGFDKSIQVFRGWFIVMHDGMRTVVHINDECKGFNTVAPHSGSRPPGQGS